MWTTVLKSLFFFQAEDGIRDVAVTGVQTCALPISHRGAALPEPNRRSPSGVFRRWHDGGDDLTTWRNGSEAARRHRPHLGGEIQEQRSEERRVGEEGRSRWAPDH